MSDNKLGAPPRVRPQLPEMEQWYLDALRRFCERRGRPPILRELATWLDKAVTTVHSAMLSLEAKGYVGRAGTTNSQADRRFVPLEDTNA